MDSGLAGNKIMVEDSQWGGGMANGSGDSGLAKYGKELLAINPDLMASFHVYNRGDADKVASDVRTEVEALRAAGFNQPGQINIGEAGNANWKGNGDNFEHLPGVTAGMMANRDLFEEYGITVLPWMDQFLEGSATGNTGNAGGAGTLSHTVGYGRDGQIM
jgi:hypothetical protein